MLDRRSFLATLPRRRLATGALIRDVQGRVCIVEPTYKELWHFPGGTIETDESPAAGYRREVLEELGVDLPIGPLLCLDWVPPDEDDPHGAMILVYDGGIVDDEMITRFRLPAEELSDVRFVAVEDLPQWVSAANQRRVAAALRSVADGAVVELGADL